jgi:hypothetical protein
MVLIRRVFEEAGYASPCDVLPARHRGCSDGQAEAVSARFEEIDWQPTPIGEISLRRRREPTVGVDVYEVKLGDDFLMSSLFTTGEVELARLALAEISRDGLDVVVGGLGLGYTARAVLDDQRVRSLHVVEALRSVINWQVRRLLPLSGALIADPRCTLLEGDFFALVAAGAGFGPRTPGRYHAVLVDIDHTPRHVLDRSHAGFYTQAGLSRVAGLLHPQGIFALWSDDSPDDSFVDVLGDVFATASAKVVTFHNPLTGGTSANTVYVATAE